MSSFETDFSGWKEPDPETLEQARARMRKLLEEEDLREKLRDPEFQQRLRERLARAAEELRKNRQDSGSSLEDGRRGAGTWHMES